MQSAGAGWEMASIAPSPMFVAGMAIATTCPVFLFGFPAGVLADRVDRRLYIVCCQVWMMLASIGVAAGVLAWTDRLTPVMAAVLAGLAALATLAIALFRRERGA